jgi:hypothetical protein
VRLFYDIVDNNPEALADSQTIINIGVNERMGKKGLPILVNRNMQLLKIRNHLTNIQKAQCMV